MDEALTAVVIALMVTGVAMSACLAVALIRYGRANRAYLSSQRAAHNTEETAL